MKNVFKPVFIAAVLIVGLFLPLEAKAADKFHWIEESNLNNEITVDNYKISHLITVPVTESINLKQLINSDNVNDINITWSIKKDILNEEKVGEYNFVPDAISLDGDIAVCDKKGVGVVCAAYESAGEKVISYLAIQVIDASDYMQDIEIYNSIKNISEDDLSEDNIISRYQYFYELNSKIKNMSDYEEKSSIQHDGIQNIWGITNGDLITSEADKIKNFLTDNSAHLSSVVQISEYEGIVVKFDKLFSTTDLVAFAYNNSAEYTDVKEIPLNVNIKKENGEIVNRTATVKIGEQSTVVEFKKNSGTYILSMNNTVFDNGSISFRCKKIYTSRIKGVFAKKNTILYKNTVTGEKILTMKKGMRFRCVAKGKSGWLRIKWQGGFGYVKSSYVKSSWSRVVSKRDVKYSYKDMRRDIIAMSTRYADILSVSVLEKTADNNNVYCIRVGEESAKNRIIINASIHAREWLNSQVLMYTIEDFCKGYYTVSYKGQLYRKLLNDVCFYFVPMVNPDGVTISQYGPSGLKSAALRKLVRRVGKGSYRTWKANARCVDINKNFPNGFGRGTKKHFSKDGYCGKRALSEKESKALYKLVEKVKPKAVINYHSAGRVIYYSKRDKVTRLVKSLTGYSYIYDGNGSLSGSFGDYLIKKRISWCTPESGRVPAPLGHYQFNSILNQYKNIIPAVARLY